MKNKNKLGLIILIALTAFAVTVCDNDSGGGTSSCTHSWGEWTEKTAATCTAAMVEERICSICKVVETQYEGEPSPHSWGNWSITTFPTSITPLNGTETRTCTSCSETENRALTEANFKPYFYGNNWSGYRINEPSHIFEVELSADILKLTRTNVEDWFKMENLTWTLSENPRKNNPTPGNDLEVSVGFILACDDDDFTGCFINIFVGNRKNFVGLSSVGMLLNRSAGSSTGVEHLYTKE